MDGSKKDAKVPTAEEVYDSISTHFARRRRELWPPFMQFIDKVSPCRLLDLGCGAGRTVRVALEKGCTVTGVDISQRQLQEVREQVPQGISEDRLTLVHADMISLPLNDRSFDDVLVIASIHHLMSRGDRAKALKEAFRVTVEGGRLMVCAWTWDQERFRERHLSRLSGREPGPMDGPQPGDFIVPWREGVEVLRLYHLYGPGELEGEVKEAGWKLVRSYFDGRNHWVEAERPK